ncbi:acyl-CoA dehydrogenase family protein [Arthrobacter sp. MDT3-24]
MTATTQHTPTVAGRIRVLGESLSHNHIENERNGTFNRESWDALRATGLLGMPFDPDFGGSGLSITDTMAALETLGEVSRDSGLAFSAVTSMASSATPLNDFGTPALKGKYLPELCNGSLIGAHAITEEGSGSDALSMSTRAVRDGGDFVLDGTKAFITNAGLADVYVIYAKTAENAGPLGITAFLVEAGTPGLTAGPAVRKMGLGTSPMASLALESVRIPAANVIGRVGGGFLVLDHVMEREILYSFIVNVGEMEARLRRCIEHARTRKQYGKAIGSYQQVAQKIVDMSIGASTSRMWLFEAARLISLGKRATREVSIAKLLTSRYNLASSLDAVQVFGGSGYLTESGLEKEVRNSIAGSIYSGTNELQYNRIASMIGLK